MARTILSIEGMSCAHCARHVQEALEGTEGVQKAAVDLSSKTAVVEHDASASVQAMADAVAEAGYDASVVDL